MNILYISSVCAQSRFDRLVKQGYINSQFQNQKFHHLLLKGLKETDDEVSINVVSFYPIRRVKEQKLEYDEEEENGVYYVYPSYTNKPILHHVMKFLKTYRFLKKHRCSDSIIVCNIMNFDECMAALFYRFFHNVKICAITADVPGLTSGSGKNSGAWWKSKATSLVYPFYKALSRKYDAYMFLAEAMNGVVNPKCKPYVVVEGLADQLMKDTENTIANKYSHHTMMYAGGLHREYGVDLMVEAFRKMKDKDAELHIYGRGNYERDLEKVAEKDSRIKYFGTRSNSEVVNAQVKAHILINPRPTGLEFVKYSFPSKTIECMASGTPLLTTRIPSIPKDYFQYVFTLDVETVEGFYDTFCKVLSLPIEQLQQKGQDAKSFIMKEKNYKVQSAKLLKLLRQLCVD